MIPFEFDRNKSVNIFEYTNKKALDNKIFIIGDEYKNTKECTPRLLTMFIERDIFLHQKHGQLPRLGVKFESSKNNNDELIVVTLTGLGKEAYLRTSKGEIVQRSPLADYVKDIVSQILWKYNFQELKGNGQIKRTRFYFYVDFSEEVPPAMELEAVA